MERAAVYVAARAHHQRRGRSPAVWALATMLVIWLKAQPIIHELKFGYRPHAGERRAESCPHDG
jgi:hypothetical protein